MAITAKRAKTKEHKAAINALASALGDDADHLDMHVEFTKDGNVLVAEGSDDAQEYTMEEFYEEIDAIRAEREEEEHDEDDDEEGEDEDAPEDDEEDEGAEEFEADEEAELDEDDEGAEEEDVDEEPQRPKVAKGPVQPEDLEPEEPKAAKETKISSRKRQSSAKSSAKGGAKPSRKRQSPAKSSGTPARQSSAKSSKKAQGAQPKRKPGRPRKTDEEKVRELTAQLDDYAQGLAATIERERSGDTGRNAERIHKGKLLAELEDIGKKLKRLGHPGFQKRYAEVAYARHSVREILREKGRPEAKDRLSSAEVSIVRKAFTDVVKPLGGTEASFRRVDEFDPQTDQPLVNDAGKPYEEPLVSVSVNKLHAIKDLVDPDQEELTERVLSFAYRHSEECVRKAVKLFKRFISDKTVDERRAIHEMLDLFRDSTKTIEVEGEERTAHWDSDDIIKHLNQILGPSKGGEELATITIDKGIYVEGWKPIQEVASQLYRYHNLPVVERTGQISNSKLLETIIYTLLHPIDHGAKAITEMFVEAGDISRKQAKAFLSWWDKEQERLAQQAEEGNEDESEQAA